MSFVGKSALITGGCSGIGFEIVKKFLEEGIENVAILDICDTQNVSKSLQRDYQRQTVLYIQTDVSKRDQVKSAFDEIFKQFGYIDYVVGNAGILCESDYERTINVNLLGILHTTYTAIKLMGKDNGGRGGVILNVSSLAAFDTYSFMPSYSASKHGIIGLQRCLSDDHYYNKYGIKFITLCPGPTDTQIVVDIEEKIRFGNVQGLKFQTASIVADCASEILKSAKNGSIWIVDDSKMREVIESGVEK